MRIKTLFGENSKRFPKKSKIVRKMSAGFGWPTNIPEEAGARERFCGRI
jgi:hypothetical protein